MGLLFLFSLSCVYSEDYYNSNSTLSNFNEDIVDSPENIVEGTVSGDVEVITENPWATSGELNYNVPSNAKDIKMANVYVNVYSGSGSDLGYVLDTNTSIATVNGNYNLGYEVLQTEECSPDGTVYKINGNDHVTRVYSDYQINYDITDILKGLNGTSISIKVDSIKKTEKFDGRIKLIALVLTYDDGDNDTVSYWIDYNQHYTKTSMDTIFNTTSVEKFNKAVWTDIVLSSTDASYKINNYPVFDEIKHNSGSYYKFNQWDVTQNIAPLNETLFSYYNNGDSAKSVLSVLTIYNYESPKVNINSISSEYDGIAYSGTINALTVKLNVNKKGNYIIQLFADDKQVNSSNVILNEGNNDIIIIDPTIRPINESTVVGNDNKNVKWTVKVLFFDESVASKDIVANILYNGYLSSDYAYGIDSYEPLLNVSFTGDVVVDIKTTYTSSGNGGRTDVWNVDLDKSSKIVGGFIILPYNWFNYSVGVEDNNMIEATFNGKSVSACGFAHDNPNIGWNFGYGVLIYDVTNLINSNGNNNLVLNKVAGNPALNPSIFVYFYNTTRSTNIKEMYLINCYDLLLNDYNKVGRINQAKSIINVNLSDINNADIYIFATGAETNDGYVVINGKEFKNCWSGGPFTTDLFKTDITNILNESNEILFVSTGGTISALPQFIITNKNYTESYHSESPQSNDNPITVKIDEVSNKFNPLKSKITAKKAIFKAKKKIKKYTITLKSGRKAIVKVKVTLKIGKKTYTAKTNAKGKATFKIKNLKKKGKYTAVIKFKGDKTYKPTSKKVKITVKK